MKKINHNCIVCQKEISKGHKRCKSCVAKSRTGKLNNSYKNGKWIKAFCVDCDINISPNCERCKSCENKRRYQNAKNHPQWKGGISTLAEMIRNLSEFKIWRTKVYNRDNYQCIKCKYKGDQLEAHHKKPFAELLSEFLKEYDQFSPYEDKETLVRLAMKWKPFWDIDNGETFCEDCHMKKHLNLNFNRAK